MIFVPPVFQVAGCVHAAIDWTPLVTSCIL